MNVAKEMANKGFWISDNHPKWWQERVFTVSKGDFEISDTDPYKAMCKALLSYE